MSVPTGVRTGGRRTRVVSGGDAVRVAAALSIVIGVVGFGPVGGALFLLVLLGALVPRLVHVPARLDAAYGITLLLAAWAGQLGLYEAISWLDVAVHTVATGLVAAVAYLALVHVGWLGPPTTPRHQRSAMTLVVAMIGAALAALWEVAEWCGHTYLDGGIYVGYDDTIGDLCAGLVGSLVAGIVLASAAPHRSPAPAPAPAPVLTVSVVIPVRDDSAELERCLGLLAAQTVAPFEVIVVDNGSVDDSAAVANRLGARVVAEPRPGIPAAAAAGYDAARGEVIARLDADSRPGPQWVDRIGARMGADPTLDALTGVGRFVDLPRGLGTIASLLYLGSYYVFAHLALAHTALWGSSMALRRSAWTQVRGRVQREDSEVHDDLDLAFALGPRRHTRIDPGLRVGVSARSLRGEAQRRRRLARARRTLRSNWAVRPPWILWRDRIVARRVRVG